MIAYDAYNSSLGLCSSIKIRDRFYTTKSILAMEKEIKDLREKCIETKMVIAELKKEFLPIGDDFPERGIKNV